MSRVACACFSLLNFGLISLVCLLPFAVIITRVSPVVINFSLTVSPCSPKHHGDCYLWEIRQQVLLIAPLATVSSIKKGSHPMMWATHRSLQCSALDPPLPKSPATSTTRCCHHGTMAFLLHVCANFTFLGVKGLKGGIVSVNAKALTALTEDSRHRPV